MYDFLIGMSAFMVIIIILFFWRYHGLEKQVQAGNYTKPKHLLDGYRKISKADKLNTLNKELDQLERERLQCYDAECRNGYDQKIDKQKERIAKLENSAN